MKRLNTIQKIAIALVMAFAVAAPIVVAQSTATDARQERRAHWGERGRRGGDHSEGRKGRMGRMFGNLDLTDAQKAQMKQIRESHRQSLQPLTAELRAKRQEIRQARQGGAFDEALVSRKLAEIAPLQAKLMGERFRLHQQMLAVLTPEQKAKLEQAREQFKAKSAERRARKQKKTE